MKTLLVLLGPTAVGKTELALQLAERLGTVIVNADSRQIYRDMPICTAAPTPVQIARVRHYFVGTHALHETFSAAQFEAEALRVLEQEWTERDTVVLTGGSMMYIDALLRGIDDMPNVDPEIRSSVRRQYEAEGLESLLALLRLLDPDYYARVDRRNTQRVLHGVEMCLSTGRPFSSFHTGRRKERPFRIVQVGLHRERAELYRRIDARVDAMVQEGLVDEARTIVQSLLPYLGDGVATGPGNGADACPGDGTNAGAGANTGAGLCDRLTRRYNSLNTVGMKEMLLYLEGTYTLAQACERIAHATRIYSKKQMTWFRRDPEITWFHPDEMCKIEDFLRAQSVFVL